MKTCAHCGRYFVEDNPEQSFCQWQCEAKADEAADDGEVKRYCCVCGEVTAARYWCSTVCRQVDDERQRASVKTYFHLGAAAELRIAADLLDRGYFVFRSLTTQCPCDLIAWRPGHPCLRIEVKQTRSRQRGVHRNLSRGNDFDILAVLVEGQPPEYLDDNLKPIKV
jgi:hypothetical protein